MFLLQTLLFCPALADIGLLVLLRKSLQLLLLVCTLLWPRPAQVWPCAADSSCLSLRTGAYVCARVHLFSQHSRLRAAAQGHAAEGMSGFNAALLIDRCSSASHADLLLGHFHMGCWFGNWSVWVFKASLGIERTWLENEIMSSFTHPHAVLDLLSCTYSLNFSDPYLCVHTHTDRDTERWESSLPFYQ